MDDIINGLLAPVLRKWIAGACGAWITVLIEKGVLTQPQVDTVIQAAIAVGLFAVVMLWTWLKNKITSKTAVTVPTETVPAVEATVAAAK
jgi:hypothetical protein